MAEATITEISTTDIPQSIKSGAGKRRVKVFIRYSAAAVTDTVTLATYVPGVADIEGVSYNTLASAINATALTWSTTTLTTTSKGAGECSVVVNLS